MKIIKKEKRKLCLLYYEKRMFERMYGDLKNNKNPEEKYLQNAIFESFLLHTRNLIDFFQGTEKKYPYKKYCDDIIIADFKDKNGNDLNIVKKWEITSTDKRKINKYLSHLSEKRLGKKKYWSKEKERFYENIKKEFNKFADNISEDYFPIECLVKKKKIKLNRDDFKINLNQNPDIQASEEGISSTDSNI